MQDHAPADQGASQRPDPDKRKPARHHPHPDHDAKHEPAPPAKSAPKQDAKPPPKETGKPPPKEGAKPGAKDGPKAAPVPPPKPPPAAVIAVPAPALAVTAPMVPSDVLPAVGIRLGRYAEAVAQNKRHVQETVRAAHARVLQLANERAATVNSEFATAEGTLAREIGQCTAEVITLGATTHDKVEQIHHSRKDAVAKSWGEQSKRVDTLRDTKTKEGKGAADSRADDVDTYSETNAKRVETTSAKNAARAKEIGKTKAEAYKNESRYDDIEEMATGMAKETADSITEKSTKVAKSIREDSKEVVGKLHDAGRDIEKDFAKQGPDAKQAIDGARDDANKGLDDLAAKALPNVDQMTAAPLKELPDLLITGTGELERLRAGAIGAIAKATEHLIGAIALGGQQRIDDIDRVANETLGKGEELRKGDPKAIDDALTQQELDFHRAGDVYANEIVVARDRGVGEIDRLATLGVGSAASLVALMLADIQGLIAKVRKPFADVTVPLERDADKVRDDALKTMVGTGDKLQKTYDDAIKKVVTELDPKVTEAKATVDKKVNEVLPPQEDDLKQLGETIDKKAKDLIEESRVARFFKSIGSFLLGALEFLGGLLLGILWAVVKFVIGLVVLIVALVVAIVLIVVLAVALFAVLAALLGEAIAALVVLIVVAVIVAVIAIVAVVAIVVGIVMTVVGIVKGIWRAITGKGLSPFQRGFLTGESVGDLVILILPFKAKIPGLRAIPLPKWMPKFLVGEHPGIPPEVPEVPEIPLGDAPHVEPTIEPGVEPGVGEQPKIEARSEQPKVEAPPDQPKAEAPPEKPKVEPPSEPKVEQPKVEQPKVEQPKVEQPKVEQPKVEQPKVEQPQPKVEQPQPKVEQPKVEQPKVEQPKVDQPKVEQPKVEQPKVEQPKVEQPKVEAQPKKAKVKKKADTAETEKKPGEEPAKPKTEAQVAAEEEAKIDAEAAKSKVPPEKATNYGLLKDGGNGKPPVIDQPLGTEPPDGYTYYYRGNRRFLRRIDADDAKWPQLTVERLPDGTDIARIPKSQRLAIPGQLAANLGERPAGHQAHHLIPDEIVRKNPLMQLAREKAGYNLDRGSNGIYLPETEVVAKGPSEGLPLHRGSHPDYSEMANNLANEELQRLIQKYGSPADIPADELAKAATELENRMRDIVKDWGDLFAGKAGKKLH